MTPPTSPTTRKTRPHQKRVSRYTPSTPPRNRTGNLLIKSKYGTGKPFRFLLYRGPSSACLRTEIAPFGTSSPDISHDTKVDTAAFLPLPGGHARRDG